MRRERARRIGRIEQRSLPGICPSGGRFIGAKRLTRRMHRKLILATIAAAAVACKTTPTPPVGAPPAPVVPVVSAPVATSAAALADHEGDSPETAVTVPANAPNEGIDFQNNWIYD